jgi:hypothetical protein
MFVPDGIFDEFADNREAIGLQYLTWLLHEISGLLEYD